MFWDWAFAFEILPLLARASLVTLQATFLGFIIAAILGLAFAIGRMYGPPWLSVPLAGLIEFIRSTPLLIQIFFIYFVFPEFGVVLGAMTAGVLALGIHYATYCSEVYRAGINAVPKGQWEAATSLNFSAQRVWAGIILPQAIPPMIPAFGNYLVAMFKETAQLSAITVVELLLSARIAGTENFRFLEPITIAGLLYFAVSYPSSLVVQQLEKRFGRQL